MRRSPAGAVFSRVVAGPQAANLLGRRMVGAWCFVDHYGPDDIADEA
ncbi:hypothetical protein [Streptomyces tendae]